MKIVKGMAILSVLSVFVLTGCVSLNPKALRTVEGSLIEKNPEVVVDSSFTLKVGSLTIDMIDLLLVHEKSLDLSKISRAEIGVYELSNRLDVEDFNIPEDIFTSDHCPEWDVIVRVREDDSSTLISACIKNEKIRAVSILQVEPSTIVVINARGDFGAILASLVKYGDDSLEV